MAINDHTTQQAAQANTAAPQQAAQSQDLSWGFLNIGSIGGISREPASDVLIKAYDLLTKAVVEKLKVKQPLEIKILQIDNTQETSLSLSSLVFVARDTSNMKKPVAYHTLILEASGPAIPSRTEHIGQRQIVVDRFAGDVLNDVYEAAVQRIVRAAYPDVECVNMDGEVVPRAFNWEDETLVRALAINAAMATLTCIAVNSSGYVPLNLTNYNGDSTLQTHVAFNGPSRLDYVGLPVRAPISVDLLATSIAKQNQGELNAQERTTVVARTGAFIDLVWAPEVVNASVYNAPTGPSPKYAPRCVITKMENEKSMTTGAQLLALGTMAVLNETNNWYAAFTPVAQHGKSRKTDLRDIGAVNIEANLFGEATGYGTPVNTKVATFGTKELGDLLTATVRKGLTYSLDVSDRGADTWYNGIFAAAASGNMQAQMALLAATDTLCGGHFSNIYKTSESPVVQNDDRIHLGFYIDENGERCDIREIDYLAVLNLQGVKSPEVVKNWSDTFTRTDYPAVQRLDSRKQMIVELVRGEVTFTGMARRITFTAAYISAFITAIKMAGLQTRLVSTALGGNYQSQRGVANFLGESLVQPMTSGAFNQSYGNVNQGGYGGRVYGGNNGAGRSW